MFFACKKAVKNEPLEIELIDESRNVVSVDATLIKNQIFFKEIVSNGKVEARKKNEIIFKGDGKLIFLGIKNGEQVVQNQILAKLEDDLIINQLEKAKIDLEKAKIEYKTELINFNLKDSSGNAEETTLRESLRIKSGLALAENEVRHQKIKYNNRTIRAPFDGVIANLDTKQGDFISSTDVLCSILNWSEIEVSFSVLENDLFFFDVGQPIEVLPKVGLKKTLTGHISEVNPIVNENGLVSVKGLINSHDDFNPLDGLNVDVIIKKKLENVIVVPKEALVLRSNDDVVFTVENGFTKWNAVEIIEENSKYYAIDSSLKIGDTIIISNNSNLSFDVKVDIKLVGND